MNKSNLENKAHIVYASDDRFAEIMGVSITSLFENSEDLDDIQIYILDSNISDENKKKVKFVCKQYNREFPIWIPAKDISQELSMAIAVDRGSLSQYARLFVSSDLPENLDRVLYLDCDTIINQSIKELWELDMEGKTIAALMDAFSKHYRFNIELKKNDIMFNSGVMLIDLKKWKEQHVEEKLLEFIISKKGKIQQGDQGTLNAILSHDTYCFAPKFNSVTIFYDFSYQEMLIYRKPPKCYSEEEIKIAIDSPVIIHFTTSFMSLRPWVEGCQHMYAGKWIEYKNLSPWKEKSLWNKGKEKWLKRAYITIVRMIPRKINIRLSGFLQAYGRPIFNKVTQK